MSRTSRRLAPTPRITPISRVCSEIMVRIVLASSNAAESTARTIRMTRILLRWSKTLLFGQLPGVRMFGRLENAVFEGWADRNVRTASAVPFAADWLASARRKSR